MNIIKKNEYNDDFYSDSRWTYFRYCFHLRNLEYIKKDLEAINTLIDVDFKKLTNEEFYCLISNFYSICINKYDFIQIFKKINGVEYDKVQRLNTRMIFKDMVTEGHGRDFSWWDETFQIVWIVATSKDLSLREDYNYSIDEINEMVKNKQIILFNKTANAIGWVKNLNCEPEEITSIDTLEIDFKFGNDDIFRYGLGLGFDFNLLKQGETEFSNNVYNNAFSIMRKRLNKKKVLEDCKQIILFLKDNIHTINDVINDEILGCPNDEYYLNLSNDINNIHKELLLKILKK